MHFFHLHADAVASILTPLICACSWVYWIVYRCEECPEAARRLHQMFMLPLLGLVAFDLWVMSSFLAW